MKKHLFLAVLLLNILVIFIGCSINNSIYTQNSYKEEHYITKNEININTYINEIDNTYSELKFIDAEHQKIMERFPHISYHQAFISLENGTLVDIRLFEALTKEMPLETSYTKEDLEFIFRLFIRHIYHINYGDVNLLFSDGGTMMGMDASDANHFHPRIEAFMEKHKNTKLFVQRIELTSIGFGFRIVVSNYKNEEFHIWPLIVKMSENYDSWLIHRYFNHFSKEWWINEHGDLWEYVKLFHYLE